MKILTLSLLLNVLCSQALFAGGDKVNILLSNFVAEWGHTKIATIFILEDPHNEGYYRGYWAEEKSLLYFPKEFHAEAVKAPGLIVRSRRFPDDFRATGNKELETSSIPSVVRLVQRNINVACERGDDSSHPKQAAKPGRALNGIGWRQFHECPHRST